MKLLNFLFVLIVLSYGIQAQVDPLKYHPLPGPLPLTNGIIDGVVGSDKNDAVVSQTKMEYSHVRHADYTWAKRVFSQIEPREKINHPIFFPYDYFIDDYKEKLWAPPKSIKDMNDPNWYRNDKNLSLWTIILENIMLGYLTVYNPEPDRSMIEESGNMLVEDGYSFKYPIVPSAGSKNYFADIKYRENINKVISSGSKSKTFFREFSATVTDVNGDSETKLVQYWKGPASETWAQWKRRLVTKGDTTSKTTKDAYIGDGSLPLKFNEIMAGKDNGFQDTLAFFNSWTEAEPGKILTMPPLRKYISSACITAYNIKEDWYFDKNRSKLERRIIAIAPVGRYNADPELNKDGYLDRVQNFVFVNKNGALVNSEGIAIDMKTAKIVEKEIFWLYFDELRNVLIKYYVYNDKSDAQFDSFDDLFIQRRFSSTAYKTSDKFDREIEDYKFGVDRLYEAERIKEEIRKWEQDVWNY